FDDIPRISAVNEASEMFTEYGGLRCYSDPVQLTELPYIILKCRRPVSGRFLALIADGEQDRLFLKSIENIYVSGDSKYVIISRSTI
ncbi:MAG: hypothetical protein N0E48_28575, partial [Candidatus Thiodiazotropha endolucinida]|nr:hypothetical protein [Candidatus Thiodiazotropha taylori]MCW4347274.1 hypothetical protein [Candidatus Thiodiazotropha endolucinida]